ncbi:MAG: tetratricopeptide repeat protein [Bacteroidales bacterium]|nr:tetratricopeptide repeat protein [Bacteroidales bacterium]
MRSIRNILLLAAALLAAGCGSRRAAVTTAAPSPYERKPITEVTEEQLKEDSQLIDALTLQETGRMDEALTAFARLTAERPQCAAAWYGQGQLLMQRGWTDSALHCTERAVALQGDNVWYLLAMAQCHSRSGNARGLVADWERIVKLQPSVTEHYYELSNAYLAAGDLEGAVEVLNRLERRVGVTEPVSLQKQRIWEAAGRADKAAKELETLARSLPKEKRYSAILAEQYMKQKKYAKAKQWYDRVLQADPDDEYIHIQLAEYYKETNHPAEADSELVRAFANPKLDTRTKIQLLASFYKEEEFYGSHSQTAFRLLEQTVKESSNPSEYALFYGDVLMRQRRYAEAAQQLEAALKQDSSRYEVWEGLLICLTEVKEREDDMAAYARRAARLFPTHTLPLYLQGFYDLRHERYTEALVPLEQAAKWGFRNGYLEAETRGLMAECYYRTGQYEKAWKAFDQYLTLRPDDIGTLNNYAYYLSEQNTNLKKAKEMSGRTLDEEPENATYLDTYGWILHRMGFDEEALPYLQKAVHLEPDNETLQQHLKEVKSKN